MDYRGELGTYVKVKQKKFDCDKFLNSVSKIVELGYYTARSIVSSVEYGNREVIFIYKSVVREINYEIELTSDNNFGNINGFRVLVYGENITERDLKDTVDLALKYFNLEIDN